MHYEIQDTKGNIIAICDNWSALMKEYKVQRKATKEPLHLEKVEDEDESDM